jgi:hypothetical protein
MRLQLRDNLPFVSINVKHQGKNIRIKNTLVDTGSGGTILAADVLSKIGIVPQADDALHIDIQINSFCAKPDRFHYARINRGSAHKNLPG